MDILTPPARASQFNREGLASARPSASQALKGVLWHSTDTGEVSRCNGSTWVQMVPPSGTYVTDPTTTKGDVIARAASALARLGVGTDGQVLSADSTQPTGLAWATSGAGGATTNATWKAAVRAVSTASVTISNPGTAVFDGVTLTTGDRILLAGQNAQNGIYVFATSSTAMTRATDANTSANVPPGMTVFVAEGTQYGSTVWRLTTAAPIVLDTTALTFTPLITSPGAGTSSERFGRGATAAGANSTAFGNSATAAGSSGTAVGLQASAGGGTSVAFGRSSSASASSSSALGYSAISAGTNSVAVGNSALSTAASSVAVGQGASVSATESSGVAVGQGALIFTSRVVTDGVTTSGSAVVTSATADFSAADVGRAITGTGIPGATTILSVQSLTSITMSANATATASGVSVTIAAGTGGGENVAVGGSSKAGEWRATALGWKAKALGISSTAIGRGAFSGFTHAIAIGRGSWTNANNQLALGFSGGNAQTDVFFESGHTHKYVDGDGATVTRVPSSTPIAIHGFDALDVTASPTNNVAGGDLLIDAGRGTGTAAGGSVKIQVAPAGGVSNNTKNALVDVIVAGVSGTSSTLGFYGVTPIARALLATGASHTVDDVITALQNLGLVRQS